MRRHVRRIPIRAGAAADAQSSPDTARRTVPVPDEQVKLKVRMVIQPSHRISMT